MGASRWLVVGCLGLWLVGPAAPGLAHPGNGIVVDERGRVWFMDTGFGLWQIDVAGRLTPQGGPGGHFLAIDRHKGFKHGHFAALERGDVEISRLDPTLLVATSYPVAIGTDGALYFPQVAGKGRVRLMRIAPGKPPQPFADLPAAQEVGFDGKPVAIEWIWGLAAGPNGSLYYTERQAVRRVAPDGTVTTVAEKVVVPDCERPEAAQKISAETGLYGLDVAADGTVYVAAGICSAVLKITPDGKESVVLRSTNRWSPQGVALSGDALYVLEYDYVDSNDRKDWLPRVRRLDPDGTVTIVAQVDERPEQADAGLSESPGPVLAGVFQPPRAHAATVHFPIVLFWVAIPASAAALWVGTRLAWRLQALVLFVMILVCCRVGMWTGERASWQAPYGPDGVPGHAWEIMRSHTKFASKLATIGWSGALAAALALIPWRGRWARPLRLCASSAALCAAIAGSAVAVLTAHYGGELAYGQGLGSDTLQLYLEEKFRTNDAAYRQLAMHYADDAETKSAAADFDGESAGQQREVQGVKLCWCPAGSFTMGSPPSEPERRPGENQVSVTLSHGFWLGKYEVTQGDWKRIAGKLPGDFTAELPEDDDLPLGNVNFAEAESYCAQLTTKCQQAGELPAGWEFRLPTEAQWEYACRAGTTTATSFGESIGSKQANVRGDKPYNGGEVGPTLGKAAKVGSYPANPWGLCDMHGNTCEWCRDWAHLRNRGGVDPDLHDALELATPSQNGARSRSRRGSCWADDAWASRSAFRQRFEPERRYDHIGFRVALVTL